MTRKQSAAVLSAGIVWLFLTMTLGYSADLSWRAAENVPFAIRSGIEIARHPADKRPATLSLVCSANGNLHLLLRTRLPIPEAYRENILGRDDQVSIFVEEGIERREQPIVVDVIAKGRDRFETLTEWLTGIDAPDTIVTPPLSVQQLSSLENWFGNTPPMRVSVVGILETGVFMVGVRAGDAIRDIKESCRDRR